MRLINNALSWNIHETSRVIVIGELVDTISFWSVNDFYCTIELNLKFLGHVSAFGSCQQLNEWMDEMIDE